jgi:hypothetical protein
MAKNLLTSLKKVGIPLSEVDLYVFTGEPENVDYGTNRFKKLCKQNLEVMSFLIQLFLGGGHILEKLIKLS